MAAWILVTILLLIPVVSALNKCAGVYEKGEQTPITNNILCYDVHPASNGTSKQYCVEFDCPKTSCTDPIRPVAGCPYCEGTCVYGNLVVKADDGSCPAECSSCSCMSYEVDEKKMTTTFHKCSLPTPPMECVG